MDKEKHSPSATAAAETPAAEPEREPADGPLSSAESRTDLQRLTAERDELRDLLQRSRAEFDNYRRRVDREKMELGEHAAAQAFRAILGPLDDFERALKTESSDKEWARGVEMIYQRFAEILKKEGLEPMDCEGAKFDPNVHFAVDRSPSKDLDEDTILAVYQKGYSFKGRLLRPAMVKVSAKE